MEIGLRAAMTRFSRLLPGAVGDLLEPAAADGTGQVAVAAPAWYRALVAEIFGADGDAPAAAPSGLRDPALAPAPAEEAAPGGLVGRLTEPLQGLAEGLDAGLEPGDDFHWRMLYGRPSQLGRGGEGLPARPADSLFDDDGSATPSSAVGVQMRLNW